MTDPPRLRDLPDGDAWTRQLLRDAPIVSSAEATRGFGPVGAAVAVGVGVLTLAFLMLAGLRETYARDLDFVEH